MLEIIIISSLGVIHLFGIFILRKLLKEKPDCVSKCCNINIEVED